MLRMKSRRGAARIAVVATLLMLLVASDARAQNLLPNSTFSSLFMLSGWPTQLGSSWSSIDSEEVPNSGSVRVSNATNSTNRGIDSDCLPTEEGHDYLVAASALWLDAESSANGKVQLRVEFYPNAICEFDGSFSGGSGLVPIPSDSWQHVETVIAAPAGYFSAEVNLWTWKDDGAGTFIAYFDNAELVSLPEPDATVLGIGAVAALVRLAAVKGRA